VDLDNSSNSLTNEATTDPSNPGLDKGNTNINRPNIFVANEVLFLPKLQSHSHLMRSALGGWEVNSIVNIAQGSSLTVFTNGASGFGGTSGTNGPLSALVGTGYNGNQRPLVTNIPCNTGRQGNQFLNVAHFTLEGYPLGTFPSNMEHRGDCTGAPYTNVDVQLAKNWYIKEKYRIKFSMDFFNIFNHPNFNSANLEGANFTATNLYCQTPSGPGVCSPTNNIVTQNPGAAGNASLSSWPTTANPQGFGAATAIQGTPRELQYSLKFTF
jgi:hypothetical protein